LPEGRRPSSAAPRYRLRLVLSFTFPGTLFTSSPDASWVFVALPIDAADEILDAVPRRPGFGSVRVVAGIGSIRWGTSIFPSRELGTYVLPVKRAVRDEARIDIGDTVEVTLELVER
jgi:hypothetical protein